MFGGKLEQVDGWMGQWSRIAWIGLGGRVSQATSNGYDDGWMGQ